MSEAADAPDAPDAPEGDDNTETVPATSSTDTKTFDENYVKGLRTEAAKHRTEARRLADELETLRAQSMTEAEKAVDEARKAGRAEARAELGVRLVDAEVRAAAAGRSVDVEALLEGLDRRRFMTDDDEPDTKAITAWLDRIAPAASTRQLDLGQGARNGGAAGAADMNALLRRATGR